MLKELFKQIRDSKIAFMLSFVAIGTIIGPLTSIINTQLYYLCMALFAVSCINGKSQRINKQFIFLLLVAAASIIFNNPPSLFKPWERWAFFTFMCFPISPLFENEKFRRHRLNAFKFLLWLSAIVGVSSFFCYLLGINYMRNFYTGEYSVNNAGWFGGITVHSMLMGPISALGATFITWEVSCAKTNFVKNRYIAYFIIFACISSALLSASRGATAAAIIGCSVVYMLRNGKQGSKMTNGLIGLVFIGIVTQPLLKPFTTMIAEKQNKNLDGGSTLLSREGKWEGRINEFASSPIIGIGFCVVNVNSEDYDEVTGTIETGTSWLSILSMLGIFGVILIWKLVFKPMVRLYKRMNRQDVLFFGIFCVFLLHMATEGYIFAGGNFMFFCFWLFTGALHAYLNTSNSKNSDL